MKPTEFSLTNHAIDRLKERFPKIWLAIYDEKIAPALRRKAIYDFFNASTEDRSVINDTRFMQYTSEKYGFDKKISIFTNGDVVFLGVTADGRNAIVTTLDKTSIKIHTLKGTRVKYAKKTT